MNLIIIYIFFTLYLNIIDQLNITLLSLFSIVLLFHLVHMIMHKVKFFNSINTFYIFKLLQLGLCSSFLLLDNKYMLAAGAFSYIIISLEFFISLDYYKSKKIFVMSFTFVPIMTVMLYKIHIANIDILYLFFMVSIIFSLINVYIILTTTIMELNNEVYLQKNRYKRAKRTNEELLVTQKKYEITYEQLSRQKQELELANKRLNRLTAEMYIQNELLRYISSVLDIKELMEHVTDSILGAIGVTTCSLVIYDMNADSYYYKVKSTYLDDFTAPFEKVVASGKLDSYFNSGKPFLDNNVYKGKYEFTADRQVGSLIVLPLIKDEITYGLLIAEHDLKNSFYESNILQFFKGIATQINIAVSNANLYKKMEEMAKRDGLTGLYNRKFLQSKLEKIAQEAVDNNNNLSVALFDIDKFKNINDTYGHLFGDEALKVVAQITEKYTALNNGLVGRFGGEEFFIVLPNKTLGESVEIMKVIHNKIKSKKLTYKNKEVNIDVSIGITSYPEICNNPEDLLRRADKAMYYSKENGRGIITIDNNESFK